MLAVGNAGGIALSSLRCNKSAFQGCSIHCISNGQGIGQGTIHQHLATPTSRVCCCPHILLLCIRAEQEDTYSNCTGHSGPCVPRWRGWHEMHASCWECSCWGVSQSHNCRGKLLSVMARAAMNVSLNVWIVRSAAFTHWLWGSTSCNLHLFSSRKCLMYFVAWLSISLSFTFKALLVRLSNCFLYTSNIVLSSNPVMGSVRMLFNL